MSAPIPVSSLSSRSNHRQAVEFLLAVFADRRAQQAEAFGIPAQDVPAEICRRWFDDVYLPGNRFFDSAGGDAIKGRIDAAAVEQFLAEFSADEALQLERFHRFLELRLELLQKTGIAPAAWGEAPAWRHIAQNAKNTRELLRGGYCNTGEEF